MTAAIAPSIPILTPFEREALAQKVAAAFARLADHKDDIQRLWVEFENLQSGETIMGCSTKTEFCEKVLGRSIRAVRYMLDGGNHNRGETVSLGGTPTDCPKCGEHFPSKSKLKKHLRREHPETINETPTYPIDDYSQHPELQAVTGSRSHGMGLQRLREFANNLGHRPLEETGR